LIFMDYDLPQLEAIAAKNLSEYDNERLAIPKKADAIGFVELFLNLPFDPQMLSPYQELLGLTAFNDGHWYVWPDEFGQCTGSAFLDFAALFADVKGENRLLNDMQRYGSPRKHPVKKGTILVDSRLLDEGANEGRANFTILHEAFHWILHQKVFARQPVILQRYCDQQGLSTFAYKRSMNGIQKTEWQANAAAAAFLMPKEAVKNALRQTLKLSRNAHFPIKWTGDVDSAITETAEMFGASNAAMRNRASNLGFVSDIPFEYRSNRNYNSLPF